MALGKPRAAKHMGLSPASLHAWSYKGKDDQKPVLAICRPVCFPLSFPIRADPAGLVLTLSFVSSNTKSSAAHHPS